ncbi:hypothetical protein GGI42DRAFT_361619 [Trichoderma sp. SZMC 28013]
MPQAISISINQQYIDGTVVAVNNGSINVNLTYKIQRVNNITFQPIRSGRQCSKGLNDKHQKANIGLQSSIIEYIREKKIKRHPGSFNLLYFYMGNRDETVTGSFYRNLQRAFWQQAVPADSVQMHVFDNQNSDESSILDELVGKLAATQRDTYIVIDGLDKLPKKYSDKLLSRLCNLSEKLKGENTCSGRHLAVAISSQNTSSLDRGKGYDKVFDLRLGPNSISSDIRKYLGNSSSDSTIFMGTTDLRRHIIRAQLEKETNNYPSLSSSIMHL